MLNKKHNLKSGNSKDQKKGLKEKSRQETKKREKIDEETNCHWIFWCCSFHETKAKKKEKERKRQKQGTKRKQKERQEGRKKEKKKRETEKEKQKKREAKKAKGERKRNTENIPKMPFSWGKTKVFCINSKERKGNQEQKKNKTKKTKNNKK